MSRSDCAHEQFDASVDVHRLTDKTGLLTGFNAEIRVNCHECKEPFVWLGVPSVGLSLDSVAVSFDGQELRVPLAPSFAWQGEGEPAALRGFSVRRTG